MNLTMYLAFLLVMVSLTKTFAQARSPIYLIENKHARGKYLTVAGASNDIGANLNVRDACPALTINIMPYFINCLSPRAPVRF